MNADDPRAAAARAALHDAFVSPDGEAVRDFVSHHLEVVTREDWIACLGRPEPTAAEVLEGLEFKGAWDSEEDGVIDVYDFSLPGYTTQYVLSVRFEGDTLEISMES